MVQYFKCKSCGKELLGKNLNTLSNYCNKCKMERRTDLDRTGRSSKKDRFKSKEVKENMY